MKTQEFDIIITEILEAETKKLIREQVNSMKYSDIENFHTLSDMIDNISKVDKIEGGMIIHVDGLTPEQLIDYCHGTSLGEAVKNLMKGLHHDLDFIGETGDVDIDTQGDENALNLIIKITKNNDDLSGDTEMKENTKDTNPTVNDKKDVILGGKVCDECGKQMEENHDGTVCDECGLTFNKIGKKPIVKKEDVKEDEDKWIQKAVNPKHKGYCTPMTKSTCTPARKALAKRFKKGIDESTGKRILTLTEEEMANLLKKIIKEAALNPEKSGGVLPGGAPGIDITKSVTDQSGKENNAALKAVEKKIKDYLNFDGNDKPEFPNQIGQGTEKVATQNTEEEDEIVMANRGRGPQDLVYDQEPGKQFKDRVKLSLVGSSQMGNPSDAANAIKTKVGDQMAKNMEKRIENRENEPMYAKEAVPVKTKEETEENEVRPAGTGAVASDIKKMKQLSSYNKKTQ